ncbi:MAG: DUF485 domain-containing protein [Prevotellaceae bacterium]|jgi:hypothetical protein|nr:DUF485 domain-containing protein [Prevotellaceae bacterium]
MRCHIERPTGYWKVIVTINGVETVFTEPLLRTVEIDIPESDSYRIEVIGFGQKSLSGKVRKSTTVSKILEVGGLTVGCRIVVKNRRLAFPWFFLAIYFVFPTVNFFYKGWTSTLMIIGTIIFGLSLFSFCFLFIHALERIGLP